ncbi:lipoprotein [Nocardiopsis terrae]|uniref:Uncharacterized protein (DUF305 family) n=1 Tax=Nocardiopsis terrae TaxID=372655 RepID=A0ABR9HDE3_9ACTN|nr:DUF305 domain-containing protein [Nocardiopsis terrae]MBE1457022.1 uncharacterized protein (DUF305 family) [Nocardiopsis terrae]GHC90169.1 lipoprotein [Nocardiopsis terrae]
MRRLALAAGTALVLLGASACTGEDGGQDSANVIAPGAPGESSTPATPDQIAALAEEQGHNEADVTYLVKMIEHHAQALEMTDLVEERHERDGIERIADRISAAQGPEITAMESWLEENVFGPARENPAHQNFCGLEGDGSHHSEDGEVVECDLQVDHEDMEGMASPEEMERLAGAEGGDFDQLFVELMTVHHQGAVTMAEEVMAQGKDQEILRMANDLIAEQNTEISRMEQVLSED